MKMYPLEACYIAMLVVSTAYHQFVSGDYMKLYERKNRKAWTLPFGMAVETARVHYEKNETPTFVMVFYENDNKDPIVALKNCWPDKEVIVRYHDNIHSIINLHQYIHMDVTVSGGSDDIYRPQNALARPYLYDPDTDKHTDEYMKPFYQLNQAGKFGACWNFHGHFLSGVITIENIHSPSKWRTQQPEENDSARMLLNPDMFIRFAPNGMYSYELMDEYQKIYAGDISANLGSPGQAESEFIPENELKFSEVIMNGASFKDDKFLFLAGNEWPRMPSHIQKVWKEQMEKKGYTIDKNLYKRTTDSAAGDTEYQNSMTMTISDNPPLHISHHNKIEVGGRAFFFNPDSSDHWILDYTFFMGYTIIIDIAGFRKKYKFIAPKEEHKREDRQKGQEPKRVEPTRDQHQNQRRLN